MKKAFLFFFATMLAVAAADFQGLRFMPPAGWVVNGARIEPEFGKAVPFVYIELQPVEALKGRSAEAWLEALIRTRGAGLKALEKGDRKQGRKGKLETIEIAIPMRDAQGQFVTRFYYCITDGKRIGGLVGHLSGYESLHEDLVPVYEEGIAMTMASLALR
ncbi:MAG: hypothetical protein K2X35_07170 [Bryobacteraceae bacterium]|nr:hypothetical protein [Bryobacteraceae bacterium]